MSNGFIQRGTCPLRHRTTSPFYANSSKCDGPKNDPAGIRKEVDYQAVIDLFVRTWRSGGGAELGKCLTVAFIDRVIPKRIPKGS